MLLHFSLVLHFAAILITFCGVTNVMNKPEKKMWKEIILFWSHVTSVFQGLSLSLRRAGRREPWEKGCPMYAPDWFWSIFLWKFISQSRFFIIWEICIILLSAFVFPCFCTVLIKNCPGALRQCGSNFFPVIILLTFKINTIYHNQLYQYIPAECLCSCSPTREHSILHWRTSLSSSSKAKKRRF